MDDALSNITIPDGLYCRAVNCKYGVHHSAIEQTCNDVISSCIHAGQTCVPSFKVNGRKRRKCIPGWNEHVRTHRERSLFWHWIWVECQRPTRGVVYDCMSHSRRVYHAAIHKVRRMQIDIQKQKLADNCQNVTAKTFWQSIQNLNPTCKGVSDIIDDVTGSQNIADLFADIYCSIYTSVPTDPREIAAIQNTIQSQCREQDMIDHYIDAYDVRLAITKLKAGKADGLHGFRSDHLKDASDNMIVVLTMLINCMLTHGYNPSQLLRCTEEVV